MKVQPNSASRECILIRGKELNAFTNSTDTASAIPP